MQANMNTGKKKIFFIPVKFMNEKFAIESYNIPGGKTMISDRPPLDLKKNQSNRPGS
jgi:hypothetical protein